MTPVYRRGVALGNADLVALDERGPGVVRAVKRLAELTGSEIEMKKGIHLSGGPRSAAPRGRGVNEGREPRSN